MGEDQIERREEMTRVDQLALEVHEMEEEVESPSHIEMWHNGAEPKHRQIARMTALGFSTDEVATEMQMTPLSVRLIKSSPLFRAVVREIEKSLDASVVKARKMLIESAPVAAQVKIELLHCPDPGIRNSASNDILKGIGVIKQEDNGGPKGPTFNIKADQVQLIATTLKEIADASK